jgi:hypothetical protein
MDGMTRSDMARSDARLYRLGCGIALIVGPALFLVDNLIHPKEFERGSEAAQLAEIAGSADRWQIAHLIGFVGAVVLIAAALGLAYLVRRRMPRLGLVAGAASVIGLMAIAFAFALDGFTWGVLGEVSSRPGIDGPSMRAALHEVQQSSWSLPYYTLILLFVAGMVSLAYGAARGGLIGARPAALLALGTTLVGIEGAVPSNAYFIVSSAIFLVGGIDAGIAILRLRDEDVREPAAAGAVAA